MQAKADSLNAEAHRLLDEGDIRKALDKFEELTRMTPENPSAWRSKGTLLLQSGDAAGAVSAFRNAVKLAPDDPGHWVALGNAFQAAGNISKKNIAHREALALGARRTVEEFGLHHMLPQELSGSAGESLKAVLLGEPSQKAESVFLVALPKSAGRFIRDTLLEGMGLTPMTCSCGVFPGDVLIWERLPTFAAGGSIAHHHIPASPTNLWLLKRFGIKPVIHLRDPRAAVYSWMHHIVAAKCAADLPPANAYGPPDEYYRSETSWKIDWLIDNRLPQICDWIDGWVKAADANGYLVTEFGEVPDIQKLCGKIANYLNAAAPDQFPVLPKTMKHNFRSGKPDEWRSAFSPAQQEKATACIPPELMSRFGWQ